MSVKVTSCVEVAVEAVEVTDTLSGDTVSSNDHCVDLENADNITIIGLQKDYSIVGDALYASVSNENAPTWLVTLVDGIVTNQIASGFVDYDNLTQDVRNAIASIDTASNTYVQTIQYDIDQAGVVNSVVTQLNATYDLDNIHSTITNIDVVIANSNASAGLTVADITTSFEGYTDAQITNINSALSTAIGSNTASINTLNSSFFDPDSGILATASAVETLETYTANLTVVFFALETATNPGTSVYDYYYDPTPVDGTNLKRTIDSTTAIPEDGDQATIKVIDGAGDDIYLRYFKGGVWVDGTPGGIVAGSKWSIDLNAYLGGHDGNDSWGGSSLLTSTIETTSKGEIHAAFAFDATLISKTGDYYKSGFGLNASTTSGTGGIGDPFISEFWIDAERLVLRSPTHGVTASFDVTASGIILGLDNTEATRNEPKGAWLVGTTYAKGDMVTSGGSSYTAILPSTGIAVTNTTYWQLLAEVGATGITGDTGAEGSTGLSTFQATVYRRLSSAPSTPSGGSFNFGTNTLTAPTSWVIAIPAGTDPVYACNYQFSITGDTGTDTAGSWSTPAKVLEDGATGSRGTAFFSYSADLGATTPAGAVSNIAAYWNIVASATYTTEIAGDTLVVTNTNTTTGWTHIYEFTGSVWTAANTFTVNGNQVVTGSLAAISANLGSITAGSLNINSRFIVDSSGNTTISSAASGARMEIKNNVIKIYDGVSGTPVVQLGDLSA